MRIPLVVLRNFMAPAFRVIISCAKIGAAPLFQFARRLISRFPAELFLLIKNIRLIDILRPLFRPDFFDSYRAQKKRDASAPFGHLMF
jgi:hypothetical protein